MSENKKADILIETKRQAKERFAQATKRLAVADNEYRKATEKLGAEIDSVNKLLDSV